MLNHELHQHDCPKCGRKIDCDTHRGMGNKCTPRCWFCDPYALSPHWGPDSAMAMEALSQILQLPLRRYTDVSEPDLNAIIARVIELSRGEQKK